MRQLVLVLTAIVLSVSPVRAAPTPEQRAWFERLSPEEAAAAIQAAEDRQRMERWDTVVRVAVTEMIRTSDVRYLSPADDLGWRAPTALGTVVKVWWALEMPKKAAVPFDVQVRWKHEGTLIRLQTYGIDRPSPNYRLHDLATVKRPGTWTIQVLLDERVLAERSFVVR